MDLAIHDQIVNNRLGTKSCCWVCEDEPDGILTYEDHHILPKHLGGTNGPLVFLCADCHTNVHKCATKLLAGKSHLPYKTLGEKQRCLALAQVIVKAELLIRKNNTNKSYVYSTIFPYDTHQKLQQLKKYLSTGTRRMTQDEVVRLAITELHKRFF